MSLKLSIVTPTYNSGQYIADTLHSIHDQEYTNFEHILFDGKSSDNTIDIVKKYSKIDWVSEPDKGQTDALNKGFKRASGDIFAWQNADDLYLPGTFEFVAQFFSDNPKVDIIYGPYDLIDEGNKIITKVDPIEWNEWKFKHWRFVPMQPTVFWRKEVHDAIGTLDTSLKYTMDVDFFAKALNKGFVYRKVPKTLGQFRVHQESKTQNDSNWSEIKKELLEVMQRNFDYTALDQIIFNWYFYRSRIAGRIKKGLKI